MKQFLNQKQIDFVVNYYSQLGKYKVNTSIKRLEYDRIYYCEENNNHHWLLMTQISNTTFQVTFTNDVGIIIKRDYWNVLGDEVIFDKTDEILSDI